MKLMQMESNDCDFETFVENLIELGAPSYYHYTDAEKEIATYLYLRHQCTYENALDMLVDSLLGDLEQNKEINIQENVVNSLLGQKVDTDFLASFRKLITDNLFEYVDEAIDHIAAKRVLDDAYGAPLGTPSCRLGLLSYNDPAALEELVHMATNKKRTTFFVMKTPLPYSLIDSPKTKQSQPLFDIDEDDLDLYYDDYDYEKSPVSDQPYVNGYASLINKDVN